MLENVEIMKQFTHILINVKALIYIKIHNKCSYMFWFN
jgi:hypothetical protein